MKEAIKAVDLPGTFWIPDNGEGSAVVEIYSVNMHRAFSHLWTSPDTFIETWYPAHFFTEEDTLFRRVESKEEGFDVIKPKPILVESTMPGWPSLLADAIKDGYVYFETSDPSIKELAESAASRMGKTIRINLV